MAEVPYTEFRDEEKAMSVATAPIEGDKTSPPPDYSPPSYPNQQYPVAPAYPNQQYPVAPAYPNQQYPVQQANPNQQYPVAPAYPNQQQQYPVQQAYPNQHPMNQLHTPQPQHSMQTVTVVQPQAYGTAVPPVNRLRAQARHVVFLVFSYVTFYLCLFFWFLLPLPIIAFTLALISLWKQERGAESTSKILGWISLSFSIISVIVFTIIILVFLIQ